MGDEIDPDALAEFQSTFAHFDKDSSGHLTDYEFKAGLAGLGTAVSDDDFPALFEQVCLLVCLFVGKGRWGGLWWVVVAGVRAYNLTILLV